MKLKYKFFDSEFDMVCFINDNNIKKDNIQGIFIDGCKYKTFKLFYWE